MTDNRRRSVCWARGGRQNRARWHGRSGMDSTFRKLLQIGGAAGRFEPFIDRMPSPWTTQSKLAFLEEDKFDIVAHDPRFGPMMTAAEIDRIIAGEPQENGEAVSRDIIIGLSGFKLSEKRKILTQCRDLADQCRFQLSLGSRFQRELKKKLPKAILPGLGEEDEEDKYVPQPASELITKQEPKKQLPAPSLLELIPEDEE